MNKKTIRKAVIPAAGYGTRFLPATKATPKEMLPIVDKPTIQYIVEEALESGIEDILIISGHGKRAIEDHFDSAPALEHELERKGKQDLLDLVRETTDVNVHYVRQKYMRGLGDAILCARSFVGDEPFAVLLGDDVVHHPERSALGQLIDVYEERGGSVLGCQMVADEQVSSYGIVAGTVMDNARLMRVSDMVEKPSLEEAAWQCLGAISSALRSSPFSVKQSRAKAARFSLQMHSRFSRSVRRSMPMTLRENVTIWGINSDSCRQRLSLPCAAQISDEILRRIWKPL